MEPIKDNRKQPNSRTDAPPNSPGNVEPGSDEPDFAEQDCAEQDCANPGNVEPPAGVGGSEHCVNSSTNEHNASFDNDLSSSMSQQACVEEWFRCYGGELKRFLRRATRQSAEADDLLQEVFVVAMRRMKDYSEQGNSRAYLYQIARNLVLGHRRKHQPDCCSHIEKAVVPAEDGGPSDDLAQLVTRHWPTLNSTQKVVIRLRITKRMRFAEIAKTLGLPINTVVSHFHRGIVRLRKACRRDLH